MVLCDTCLAFNATYDVVMDKLSYLFTQFMNFCNTTVPTTTISLPIDRSDGASTTVEAGTMTACRVEDEHHFTTTPNVPAVAIPSWQQAAQAETLTQLKKVVWAVFAECSSTVKDVTRYYFLQRVVNMVRHLEPSQLSRLVFRCHFRSETMDVDAVLAAFQPNAVDWLLEHYRQDLDQGHEGQAVRNVSASNDELLFNDVDFASFADVLFSDVPSEFL
jgi:hypothetical protein